MNNKSKAQSLNRKSYWKFTLSCFSATCLKHVGLLWPIRSLDRKQVHAYTIDYKCDLFSSVFYWFSWIFLLSCGHQSFTIRQTRSWEISWHSKSLHWRHNDHNGVSNHQPHVCLLNRLFRRRSKKTSKLRITGLCVGNSPGQVNSPHKGPVTRKMFPFDDIIMC